jgi:hypothetical protein
MRPNYALKIALEEDVLICWIGIIAAPILLILIGHKEFAMDAFLFFTAFSFGSGAWAAVMDQEEKTRKFWKFILADYWSNKIWVVLVLLVLGAIFEVFRGNFTIYALGMYTGTLYHKILVVWGLED